MFFFFLIYLNQTLWYSETPLSVMTWAFSCFKAETAQSMLKCSMSGNLARIQVVPKSCWMQSLMLSFGPSISASQHNFIYALMLMLDSHQIWFYSVSTPFFHCSVFYFESQWAWLPAPLCSAQIDASSFQQKRLCIDPESSVPMSDVVWFGSET